MKPGHIYTIDGIRYAHVLGHTNEDYARLVHNRFAMYTNRHTKLEKRYRAFFHATITTHDVWISLLPKEYSHKDAEVALQILKDDKWKSGPNWDRYYSDTRLPNEVNF